MMKHKWTLIEQARFLRRIGELLARGYPIAAAMESVSFQMPPSKKAELTQCLVELKKGLAFHEILTNLGFQNDLIGYVYFAEQHGSFADALLEGSNLAMKKGGDMHKLFKLLQYPFILIIITGFLFLFVEKTLLPKFTTLFTSMNLEANFFTKVVYTFGNYFPSAVMILFILLSLLTGYYFFVFRKISILQQKKQLTHIPFLGHVLKLLYTHYFSTQLSFLLSGGISFSEALLLFETNQKQPFYSELAKQIKLKLVTGVTLESILSTFSFFENELSLIVKHGQENGKLEQELLFYSQHCIVVLEELMEKSLKTIQPLLYLFIGFLVVSMYLAILLPMFHLMDGI
ncbi:competence type IV pilus assembly protein ComGB [Bacillus sp. EB600]|uniref:competence type IV pilus assembly protein ComGB n=1 Tax=Bacillus sp. EB600 TaxID=2806345 RepID=UPI0021087D01|nr:competence type IV pilus assembly protein ComGB [Bacillus sp. EB600]MCQ6278080.1 type II secretion system F family protein [Bacillus sp. EB600]